MCKRGVGGGIGDNDTDVPNVMVPEVTLLLTLASYEPISFAWSSGKAGLSGRWEDEATLGINSPYGSSEHAGLRGRCVVSLDTRFPIFDKVG